MNSNQAGAPNRWVLAAAKLYFFFLFLWFALYLILGDGLGYLGLVNALAPYLFLPLPVFVLIATRKAYRRLILRVVLGVILFAFLWGSDFMPKANKMEQAAEPLRVMTFNILGRAGSLDPVLQSIQEEDPDVLFLQELTPDAASFLSLELKDSYPYQVLAPGPRASGMGVMSKNALEPLDVVLPGTWVGKPQVLSMQWQGEEITLVNFHTVPTSTIWPWRVLYTFERREAEMGTLAEFAQDQVGLGPLIVAGDANATRLNEAYKSVAAVLQDAWRVAGFGLGHSFPGPYQDGSNFTRISYFLLPHWVVSIDYIFYSQEFVAGDTWMGAYYGGSDHRSVVSELYLLPNP